MRQIGQENKRTTCFVPGNYIDGVGGLIPVCARIDCRIWKRCLDGGRVGESGTMERGAVPGGGVMEGGKPINS